MLLSITLSCFVWFGAVYSIAVWFCAEWSTIVYFVMADRMKRDVQTYDIWTSAVWTPQGAQTLTMPCTADVLTMAILRSEWSFCLCVIYFVLFKTGNWFILGDAVSGSWICGPLKMTLPFQVKRSVTLLIPCYLALGGQGWNKSRSEMWEENYQVLVCLPAFMPQRIRLTCLFYLCLYVNHVYSNVPAKGNTRCNEMQILHVLWPKLVKGR